MVEDAARHAVLVVLVAEGVLDGGDVARLRAHEGVRAHRHRGAAVQLDLVVPETTYLRPCPDDCEAGVLALKFVWFIALATTK